MCVGEEDTSFGKAINVRGFRLRVPAHAADPIVQIIDSNEEDIWFFDRRSPEDERKVKGG